MQFAAQHTYYQEHYAGADFLVILVDHCAALDRQGTAGLECHYLSKSQAWAETPGSPGTHEVAGGALA